jgi:DNA-3-methyladenine glycosylase II
MEIFVYGDVETDYLKSKDKKLGAAIEAIGPIRRETQSDLFASLVRSMIGQQISTKAQATIWARLARRLGDVTPESVLSLSEAEIQSFGITFKKASYIRGAAAMAADGRFDIGALRQKTDSQIRDELVKIDGIGVWTAEMLMLFSMQRPNILSYGDLAILRGMRMLYRHKDITRQLFEKYRRRYSPYGSVASLYLWAVAGGAIEGLMR